YGKIIVIGVGVIHKQDDEDKLRIKAFASDDERELLQWFANILEDNKSIRRLCAHNGKEFDFPYLCRRMLVNKVKLPSLLCISNLKPWEIPHIDTLEMWKFGDWKNYTSLETLATIFDIPTSKSDIDGSQVNTYYYIHKALDKIATYCKNDVLVLVQLYLSLMQLKPIEEKNVTIL
ncbi:MAG TPA: ribonuclease H-like domain-containing protein, partial [Cytophagales bacterium]|nr:ribonuclease H-like domain-containing protein [Cytophagales bacterium]